MPELQILKKHLIGKMRFIAVVLILLIPFPGCNEDKKDDFEKIFSYPTKPGSEWNYYSESVYTVYESETSDKIIDTDTVAFPIKVKIEKDTLLNDTMNVLQFVSIIEKYGYKSTQYYFINSEGLNAYATSKSTGHIFAKKNNPVNFVHDMLPFSSDVSLFSDAPSIYIIKPRPRLNLKFPLRLNSKWTYSYPSEPFNLQIDKEVVGYEYIKINDKTYSCYLVSWDYLDNEYFGNTRIYDWISEEGLIKREIIYDRVTVVSEDNLSWENFQLTETISLTGINLFGF